MLKLFKTPRLWLGNVVRTLRKPQKKFFLSGPATKAFSGHRKFSLNWKKVFSLVVHPFNPPPLFMARPLRKTLFFAAYLMTYLYLESEGVHLQEHLQGEQKNKKQIGHLL